MAKATRDAGGEAQTAEEVRVGRAVSEALAKRLVSELHKKGIPAYRATPKSPVGRDTLQVKGEFLQVDEGDQTVRTVVGFGLGGTEVRTRIWGIQNGKVVAEAYTVAKSSLKPGMAVTLGAGAAADKLATSAAVGAGTTVASEVFFTNVEADARRTAKKVAERIHEAYIQRGWLRE